MTAALAVVGSLAVTFTTPPTADATYDCANVASLLRANTNALILLAVTVMGDASGPKVALKEALVVSKV